MKFVRRRQIVLPLLNLIDEPMALEVEGIVDTWCLIEVIFFHYLENI